MRCSIEKAALSLAFLFLFFAGSISAQSPTSGLSQGGYDHDRFAPQQRDYIREFRAFTVSFDTEDDERARGVPEWVAYELRRKPPGLGSGPARPSRWKTDEVLHQRKVVPSDATYRGSGYDLAHLCMKSHAWRLGREADRGSHTILNACPQLHPFNAGIWLGLELLTGEWADIYGRIWVIAGPVFDPNREVKTIGDKGEVPADIPHAFYKVVVRESEVGGFAVLAFLLPHEVSATSRKRSASLLPYLVSVDHLEKLTELDFLAGLPDKMEDGLEASPGKVLWPGASDARTARAPGVDAPSVIAREQGKPGGRPANRELKLRVGIKATAAQIDQAESIQAAGWLYVMPKPKSSNSRWGNYDRRTTWWLPYWINIRTGKVSSKVPRKENQFSGDGIDLRGWRKGGSPREKPTVVEWLCSESDGIRP